MEWPTETPDFWHDYWERWDDEGEVTMVESATANVRSGDAFVITRTGNFFGLSDDAIVMLAQMEDGQ